MPYIKPLAAKTCFRCGSEFRTHSRRVCPKCRKRNGIQSKSTSRKLTFREKQIASLVCEAKLNKEIAFELHLTEGTVKEYLNRIYRKLEVKNRTELAIWTFRNLELAPPAVA